MERVSEVNDESSRLKTCVIVPTYNNAKTLHRVLDSISGYTSEIIVVNDGSSDQTAAILTNYSDITQIHHPKNMGKGMALRSGFQKAREAGYHYAITIDSDGQHFASDIPDFIAALTDGDALIIGSRNMNQLGIPKKSNFGNRFSNFWFWFETGIRLSDTQSGYRLYPLDLISKKYFTRKFEFEIEVIVRAAWRGVTVKNIPIEILYDPRERVSHFRPFRDFTRISILNTVLVLIMICYIKPRDFVQKLRRKGLKKFLRENILASNDSNLKKSLSIALGVFIGVSPLWGCQTVVVLFLALVFKLNKMIAFIFSNVSFPPLIPLIIYGSLKTGALFIDTGAPLIIDNTVTFETIKNHLIQYIVGSFILAGLMAIVFGISGYVLLSFFSTFRDKK